jgi:hypothetical protein
MRVLDEPDIEQQIVRDAAAGKADVGWVATKAFDTVGLPSFQALIPQGWSTARRCSRRAIVDSDISTEMMADLDQVGVRDLRLLASGLRKPARAKGTCRSGPSTRG